LLRDLWLDARRQESEGTVRIGIATFGSDGGRSGIGQYVVHLLRELAARPQGHELEVLVLESERGILEGVDGDVSVLAFPDRIAHPVVNLAWHHVCLPALCRRRGYDLLFLTAANRRLPVMAPCPTVGTVHDLASLSLEGKYDRAHQVYHRRVLPFLLRRLDRIITVSESSKRDIVRHAGVPRERVHVIPLGVEHDRFQPVDPGAALARLGPRYGLRPPYILCVCRIEHPGKNHVNLIEAFARLKRAKGIPHQLVLAGPERERAQEVRAAAAASGYAQDISFPGWVRREDLADLYAASDLFVFPSLYEGFGLPVLEAMACGVPVATSDISSMPEVAGGAAALFNPREPGEMAARMHDLLAHPAVRERAIRRGLSLAGRYHWTTTAARTLDVLTAAAAVTFACA